VKSKDAYYSGDDLEIFQHAHNWKRYIKKQIAPYFGRRVLEVGAGIGGTTTELFADGTDLWVCLEPDAVLAKRLEDRKLDGSLPAAVEIRNGRLGEMELDMEFDTVLYIDVLEHIEDDRREVSLAAKQLSQSGHLIVMSPAHQWLFSALDTEVGHFRRYSRLTLADLTPEGSIQVRLRYLDSTGLLASLANRLVLKASLPTRRQILIWDRFMVPFSRILDPLLGHRAGKSILAVWQKSA
jgi:2-polyprenyl-3-methyl-5-hydroxy-6-metoxy-1,4-benzoquinol methylase